MFTISKRIQLVSELKKAFDPQNDHWKRTVENAYRNNAWFTPEYTALAVHNIINQFLNPQELENWVAQYPDLEKKAAAHQHTTVGIVMAGNIPLVGFHDFLAVFVAGFKLKIKLSSKDTTLWQYVYNFLATQSSEFADTVSIVPMLKECDAYIATGSNNSARYFEQYFGKYPNIIRSNRTSVAVLTGKETPEEVTALADSISTYFGLGCRNISKIYVPQGFNWEQFIQNTQHHSWQREHNKYKNNYDYQLAMYILNKVQYMSNEASIFVENKELYAPLSVVHYEYYKELSDIYPDVRQEALLQCVECSSGIQAALQQATNVPVLAFGTSQSPGLTDYADHVDTLQFLSSL